jgi:hypothetical protein
METSSGPGRVDREILRGDTTARDRRHCAEGDNQPDIHSSRSSNEHGRRALQHPSRGTHHFRFGANKFRQIERTECRHNQIAKLAN